jgi:hypothetical protein
MGSASYSEGDDRVDGEGGEIFGGGGNLGRGRIKETPPSGVVATGNDVSSKEAKKRSRGMSTERNESRVREPFRR